MILPETGRSHVCAVQLGVLFGMLVGMVLGIGRGVPATIGAVVRGVLYTGRGVAVLTLR